MDRSTSVFDSVTPSNESDDAPMETATDYNVKSQEDLILEGKAKTDIVEQKVDVNIECTVVNSTKMTIEESQNISQNEIENVLINETDSVPLEHAELLTNITEETVTVSSDEEQNAINKTCEPVSQFDAHPNSPMITSDNVVNEKMNAEKSVIESNLQIPDVDFEHSSKTDNANDRIECSDVGPNLTEAEHIHKETIQEPILTEDVSVENNESTNLQKSIESNVEDMKSNLSNTKEQLLEDGMTNVKHLEDANLISNVEQSDVNLEQSVSTHLQETNIQINLDEPDQNNIQEKTLIDDQELITDVKQPIQDNVSQICENSKIDITKDTPTEILQKESIGNLVDQELSNAIEEEIIQSKEIILRTDQDISIPENNDTSSAVEQIDSNATEANDEVNEVLEEEILTEPVTDTDSIEKQMSDIVQQDEQSQEKAEETISIVEAISRDFDETDSEDIDKLDGVEESKSAEVTQDNEMVGVTISDQLQHGTVTVTDTTGQIYYVQSVEDLIVVGNDDMSATLDQPETFEVTVLREVEESIQTKPNPPKAKEKPPIPSHILGRNIDNPVIDTFRNGKVPPKPRLGVKIPYKNLTSQIVSKDEIAKEVLERQKQKYKHSGQTTRELLFAKKLTQRLTKKISPQPFVTTTSTTTLTTHKGETINNSDLLAILEGDEEDPESRKIQDIKVAGTSKSNVSVSIENKVLEEVKPTSLSRNESDKKQGSTPMSKVAEREIALKQLKELPIGPARRRRTLGLPIKKAREEPELENELVLESDTSARNPINQEEKKYNEKIGQPDNKVVEATAKPTESKSQAERKKPVEIPVVVKTEDKHKTSDTKISAVIKSEHVETVQAEVIQKGAVKPDEVKQLTSHGASKQESIVKEKQISIEKGKVEVANIHNAKPTEVKQSVSHSVSKIELTDANVKKQTTEVEKIVPCAMIKPESAEVTVKIKVDEVKQSPSLKIIDNPKKVETPAKPISTKIMESSKVIDKIDSVVSDLKEEFVERKYTSNPPVKTYTRKRKSIEDISATSNIPDKKPVVLQKDTNIPPNTYVTKSSRIIKRKVIWDPDEPSTARSLATRSPKADLVKPEKTIKPEVSSNRTEKKFITKPAIKSEISKSPRKSPDINKVKKRLSEVDKLLMDEGAVNMLYAFKNVDDAIKKKKSSVISLDKAQRELMNKTNELKKDLKINSDKVSPKSLRRKDSPVPTPTKKVIPASVSRKKSKDSNRSSLHSPPASPGMIYLNHAEASRIIRRHSSSSYSSIEGDFNVEKTLETNVSVTTPADSEKTNKRRNASSNMENNKVKKPKRSIDKENVTVITEKSKIIEETSKNFNKLIQNEKKELKYEKYKTFSVKKMDHMVQIILLPSFNNEAYLTPEILNELCSIIKELQDDKNCNVVVISSSASSFCHGINYKTLLSDKEQSRKAFAKKLATCVTNFLRVLATFPKILVAGVHGDTVGLGVTILPLFDMVIASDTATFSIPNARLGCATEGGSLLSLPHLMHNVLVSELLYASRKLIAAEALRLGMVTRVLWPDKFQQELVCIVKSISNQSPQFMQLTKKQLRQRMTEHLETSLSKEVDILTRNWTSSECQKNFGVYG